jgi:hypothetical protein
LKTGALAITAGDDGVEVDTEDGADLVLGYTSPGIETFDWTDSGSADRLRIAVLRREAEVGERPPSRPSSR